MTRDVLSPPGSGCVVGGAAVRPQRPVLDGHGVRERLLRVVRFVSVLVSVLHDRGGLARLSYIIFYKSLLLKIKNLCFCHATVSRASELVRS
jgi:hypothetical protein